MNHLFITLEGGCSCGKSTQSKRLEAYLKDAGRNVTMTFMPGGTEIGDEIRSVALKHRESKVHPATEFFLMCAAMVQSINEVIIPALVNGDVISDRYFLSTIVYQLYGRKLMVEDAHPLYADIIHKVIQNLIPDIVFVLDVPVEEMLSRRDKRGDNTDRFDDEKLEFHKTIREAYRQMAMANSDSIILIDGSRSEDEVFNGIVNHLKPILVE
jgi:dTMP kinase